MSTAPPLPVLKRSDGSYTVPQAFDELVQSLQIEQYKPVASKQQQTLRERLDSRIALVASYLTGSYRRNTQIIPLDDIDLLLVLDPEVYAEIAADPRTGPTDALDLVKTALREAYPRSEIERYDRCLRIQFAGTGIGFDVIPAFQINEDVFLIPDESLPGWVPTNPKEYERLVSHANQEVCGGMLVPLVKLLKACNEHIGKPLTGFHIEMMAYYALQHAPETYRTGVAYLLNDFASRVYWAVQDPWPLGRQVDDYLGLGDRLEAARALRRVADRAADAVAADGRGDPDAAHAAWAEVFGEWYPVTPEVLMAERLSVGAAANALRRSARISATSAGLVAAAPGLATARGSTSHGGRAAPHRSRPWSGEPQNEAWHERQIAAVMGQFTALSRLTPEEAAADPELWPVGEEDVDTLYAVLVGDQRTNFGTKHRLLILVPKDAPAVEPAIYDLRPYRPAKITSRGWRPKRGLIHQWSGGVMCTHAARDRWDGRLITLVIWAVDWLFRQDYRQRSGKWIGPQIDHRGHFLVDGVVQGTDRRLRKRGRLGRRVPL